MKNSIHFTDSSQLAKAVIEQKTGIQYNATLTFIDNLSELSILQDQVFYHGIITIGSDTAGQKIIIEPGHIHLQQNSIQTVLFNNITDEFTNYPIMPVQGTFYGFIFTPTKNSSKSHILDL
jgi:hypothetical protein